MSSAVQMSIQSCRHAAPSVRAMRPACPVTHSFSRVSKLMTGQSLMRQPAVLNVRANAAQAEAKQLSLDEKVHCCALHVFRHV